MSKTLYDSLATPDRGVSSATSLVLLLVVVLTLALALALFVFGGA